MTLAVNAPTPDATNASKGKIQLAGVLSGTAASPALSVARQNNTTNSTVTGVRVETGWGIITNTATASITKAVTFGTAFTTVPIITVSIAGDSVASGVYGNGGNSVEGRILIKSTAQTTTGFNVFAHTGGGTNFGTGFTYFTWVAIGA